MSATPEPTLREVHAAIEVLDRKFEERFDRMEERFVRFDERLDGLDKKVDRKFGIIADGLADLQKRFGHMESKMDAMTQDIRSLDERVAAIDPRAA